MINIKFEDAEQGIEDFSDFLSIGKFQNESKHASKDIDSLLNYYHIGAKQAIGYLNPSNDNWEILTCTKKESKEGIFRTVQAPYNISEMSEGLHSKDEEKWTGKNKFGTIISINTTCETLFGIIPIKEIKPNMTKEHKLRLACKALSETIGYQYEHKLSTRDDIKIVIASEELDEEITVKPVLPPWKSNLYESKTEKWDLGNGEVNVVCEFGLLEKGSKNLMYYKCDNNSRGLEVAIDGRKYEHGNLSIWDIKPQFHHDRFLFRVQILSCDKDKVPVPLSDKSGLDKNNIMTQKLYEFVKKIKPTALRDDTCDSDSKSHEMLIKELENKLKSNYREAIMEKNKSMGERYGKNNMKLDLYMFDKGESYIYEGKVSEISIRDIYQVLGYNALGLVNGSKLNYLILVGKGYSQNIKDLVDDINAIYFVQTGQNVRIKLKTWDNYGIIMKKQVA